MNHQGKYTELYNLSSCYMRDSSSTISTVRMSVVNILLLEITAI